MIATATSSALRPLGELIEPRPERPETVLTLQTAVTDRLGTVRSFEFPPSIKHHVEQVLDAVAEGRGRAFWVQSEYGGGKTHFIAALTALLGQSPAGGPADAEVWTAVNDAQVRARAQAFTQGQLLPVAISCKGIMPVNGQYAHALLDLLMDGFSAALETYGLTEQIPVRSEQELFEHFRRRPEELRSSINSWVRARYGAAVEELYDNEPTTAARAYSEWYRQMAGGAPAIEETVVDWLVSFCRRLKGAGFDGLLVVIDEFATLQGLVTAAADVAGYEDVLEALGWLVPDRLRDDPASGFGVYTIVASQKGHPVKLAQRYSSILLLARDAQQDYEIIVSRRVRTLRPERLADVDRYFHRNKLQHSTYAGMSPQRFREVFPFQPRVFDAIWQITAASGDVAAARFGIAAVWDTLQQVGTLDATRLLTVSDLVQSNQFQNDLKATTEYREVFRAYQAAQTSAKALGYNAADAALAGRVLDALFVDYLAYRRSPRWLTTQELAEAVLAESASAFIPPADQVLSVLSRLKQLRQVQFGAARGAQFQPEDGGGPLPVEVLNKAKAELEPVPSAVADLWASLLLVAANPTGLWSDLKIDAPKSMKAQYHRILYPGVVELRHSPSRDLAIPATSNRHFHVVVLTHPTAVAMDDLDDARVAVIVPGELTDEEVDMARTALACDQVLADNRLMAGPTGKELRAYIQQQKTEAHQKLAARQARVYGRGRICTKTGVTLPADAVFRVGRGVDALETVVEAVLGAAYDQLEKTVQPAMFRAAARFDPQIDSGKVFAGLIGGSTQPADVGAGQNFGPGLGMSKSTSATILSLDRERYGIALILQRLAGSTGGVNRAGGVNLEELYERLGAPPFGIPQEVMTLWLLACVRSETVGPDGRHIELKLQRNSKIRLKTTAAAVPGGTITFLNVKNLDWSAALRNDLVQLRVSDEVPFGEVVAYVKVLNSTLRAPTEPEQVMAEEDRLQRELEQGTARVTEVRRQLHELARMLNSPLPPDAEQSLTRLQSALTVPAVYEREAARNQLREAYPQGAEELRRDWTLQQGWAELASHDAELATLHQFLRTLVSRLARQPGRYAAIVQKAEFEVLPCLDLTSLLAAPSAAGSVLRDARVVHDAYLAEYRVHHRDYYAAIDSTQPQLAALRERAAILEQLNKLRAAGPPNLGTPQERVAALTVKLRLCPHATDPELPVSGNLTCADNCGLDPLALPPVAELNTLKREVEAAIRQRVNAVKAAAIQSVLARSGDSDIQTFLSAIQAGQFEGLLEVLSDELIGQIDSILERERVRTVRSHVLSKLATRYSTIQKAQIGDVAEEFRRMLEAAFAELERDQPGAVVQLQLFGD